MLDTSIGLFPHVTDWPSISMTPGEGAARILCPSTVAANSVEAGLLLTRSDDEDSGRNRGCAWPSTTTFEAAEFQEIWWPWTGTADAPAPIVDFAITIELGLMMMPDKLCPLGTGITMKGLTAL